jgi:hypothetical protein
VSSEPFGVGMTFAQISRIGAAKMNHQENKRCMLVFL